MLLNRSRDETQVWLAQVDWFLSHLYISLTVIAALAKNPTESDQVWERMQALEKLNGNNNVTVEWVLGHHGIPGNEEGDKLVKEGINAITSDQTVGVRFDMGKEVIRSHWDRSTWIGVKTCKVVASLRPWGVHLYQVEQKSFRQLVGRRLKCLCDC